MPFNQFQLSIDTGILESPNDHYRNLTQAFQDEQWDNTSTKTPEKDGVILEQDGIGLPTYHCVEAWVKPATEATVTAQRNSGDFIQLIFRSIDYKTVRGLYYQYNGDYWIIHDKNIYDGLPQAVSIRRCTNALNIIDPMNGALVTIPCCVDYDMSAPAEQVSRYVNTPNNHAVVILQGNEDTLRLCKTNTRFMLDGRPFKLWGYQKSVHTAQKKIATLIYLDMYLDEIHAEDDRVNQIADNGTFDYKVKLNMETFAGTQGAKAQLDPVVLLNGTEVVRDIEWVYDPSMVAIDENYSMTLISATGETEVRCVLKGNPDVYATCKVTIGEAQEKWTVAMNPEFTAIRQYESIDVTLTPYLNGVEQSLTIDMLTYGDAISIEKLDKNKYRVTGKKISPMTLISLRNVGTVTENRYIKVVSMMG